MNPKTLVPVGLVCAVIGGAGGAALVAGLGDGDKTTTVVQQAPLVGAPASDSKSTSALTPREIYKRDAPGVVFVRSEIVQRSESPFDLGPSEQRGEASGSGFVTDRAGNRLPNDHVIDGGMT